MGKQISIPSGYNYEAALQQHYELQKKVAPTKTPGISAPSAAEEQPGHNAFMTTASVPYSVHERQTGARRALRTTSLSAIGSKSSNPKISAAGTRRQSKEHNDLVVVGKQIDVPKGFEMAFQQYCESQKKGFPSKIDIISAPLTANEQSDPDIFRTTTNVPSGVPLRQTGARRNLHTTSLPAVVSTSSNPKIPVADARLQSEEHGDSFVIDLPKGYNYDMVFQQYYESQKKWACNKTAGMPAPSVAGEQSGSDASKTTSVASGFHTRQTGAQRTHRVTSLPALHSASSNPKESQKKLSCNKTAGIYSPAAAQKQSGHEAVKTTSVPSIYHMKQTSACGTPHVTSLPALHSASSNSTIPPADTRRQPEDYSDLVVGKRIDIPKGYNFERALRQYYGSCSEELELPTPEKANQGDKICIDESEKLCDSHIEHPFTNETTPETEASSSPFTSESETLPIYPTSDTSSSSPDDNEELKFIQRSNCESFGHRGSFKAWFDSSSFPSESARRSSSRNRFPYTHTFRPQLTPIHEVSERGSESSCGCETNKVILSTTPVHPGGDDGHKDSDTNSGDDVVLPPLYGGSHGLRQLPEELASSSPFIFEGSVDESEVLPNYCMSETFSSSPGDNNELQIIQEASHESDDRTGSVQAIHGSSHSSLSSRSSTEVHFQYSVHPSSSPPGLCNADEVSEQQYESDYGGEVFYVSCSEESSASQQFRDVEFIPAEVDSPLEYESRDPHRLGSQGSCVFEVTEVDDKYTLGNEYERECLLRSQQLDVFEVTELDEKCTLENEYESRECLLRSQQLDVFEVTELDEKCTVENEYEIRDPCHLRSQGSGVFEVTELDDKYTFGNEIPHGDLTECLNSDVGAETPITYVAADGNVPECKIPHGDLSESLKADVGAETPLTYVAADGDVPECKTPTEQESVFQKDKAIQCRYPFPETMTNITDGDKPQYQLMLEYLRLRCRPTEEQESRLSAMQQARESESHQPPQRSRAEYSWDFPQVTKTSVELPKLEPYQWDKLIKGTKGRIIGYTHPIPEHVELRKAIKEHLEDNEHPYRHADTPDMLLREPPYPHRTPYHERKNWEEYKRQLTRKEAREARREAKDAEMFASMRRMYEEIRNDLKPYPKGSKQIAAVIEKAVKARYAPTVQLPPLPKPQAQVDLLCSQCYK